MADLIAQCTSFVETTGRLGDVVLMHPHMLHAVSQNHRGTARFITNPPIAMKEPMRFDRAATAEQSVLRQQRMARAEQARLAEASS